MKDTEAFNIQSTEFFKKMFSHNHDMQKMTEYYSKTPMGGCGKSLPPQEAFLDTLKCQPCKNSILNK
ncbi:hypothetical protein IRZ53_14390 [Pseudomonas fulva]|uniref:hypothetical protein n=1 Tax=Pseudomonas fulva TaxID=47880 RepID=UPI0018AB5D4C|nr:hypothetical protein [Pseudomonas fulva]MBF8674004.1 hypothetical protein [Pseudomonas fulva]MBF8697978.1 hypothetical protein [Pseudomonas fulva]